MQVLDTGFLKQLKQVNISKDVEKTKARFKEVWKASSPAQKKEIQTLAAVAMNTLGRIANTGSINARLTFAIAQVLNVDPLYLTGEIDAIGEYTDKSVNALLRKHGYNKNPQKKPRRKAEKAEKVHTETDEEIAARFESELMIMLKETRDAYIAKRGLNPLSQLKPDALAKLTDEDILTLLRSLRLKVDIGVPGAQERLTNIQELLLF